jgi:hypothetical protein
MRSLLNRDFVAGLALSAFGVTALIIGAGYNAGTAIEMGAGYMPRLLAGGLVLFGAIIAIKGIGFGRGSRLPSLPVWPLFCVLAGITAFGLLISRAGLIAAIFATVCAGKLASRGLSWLQAVLLAAFLSLMSALLFVWLLGIPMRIFPG